MIVTFLPPNQRGEEQCLGRAGRQGQRGSGELVICDNFQNFPISYMENFLNICTSVNSNVIITDRAQLLMELRNLTEHISLSVEGIPSVRELLAKEEMFRRICKLIDADSSIRLSPTRLGGIKEQWAFFHAQLDLCDWTPQQQQEKFEEFFAKLSQNIQCGAESTNPFHFLKDFDRLAVKADFDLPQANQLLERCRELGGADDFRYKTRRAIVLNNEGNCAEALEAVQEAKKSCEADLDRRMQHIVGFITTGKVAASVHVMCQFRESVAGQVNWAKAGLLDALNDAAELPELSLDDIMPELSGGELTAAPGTSQERAASTSVATERLALTPAEVTALLNTENDEVSLLVRQLEEDRKSLTEQLGELEKMIQANVNMQQKGKTIEPLFFADSDSHATGAALACPRLHGSVLVPVEASVGYLGYGLGALSVVVGVGLVCFFSGLVVAVGVGAAVAGLVVAYKNYCANQNGTYSTEAMLWEWVKTTTLSVGIAAGLTVGVGALAGLSPAAMTALTAISRWEAVPGMAAPFLAEALSRYTAAFVDYMQGRSAAEPDMQVFIAQVAEASEGESSDRQSLSQEEIDAQFKQFVGNPIEALMRVKSLAETKRDALCDNLMSNQHRLLLEVSARIHQGGLAERLHNVTQVIATAMSDNLDKVLLSEITRFPVRAHLDDFVASPELHGQVQAGFEALAKHVEEAANPVLAVLIGDFMKANVEAAKESDALRAESAKHGSMSPAERSELKAKVESYNARTQSSKVVQNFLKHFSEHNDVATRVNEMLFDTLLAAEAETPLSSDGLLTILDEALPDDPEPPEAFKSFAVASLVPAVASWRASVAQVKAAVKLGLTPALEQAILRHMKTLVVPEPTVPGPETAPESVPTTPETPDA